MSCYVIPEVEFLVIQSTVIWILPSKTVYSSLNPSSFLSFSGLTTITKTKLSLTNFFDVAGLPITMPSNINHLCLFHGACNWTWIMLGVTVILLIFSSTMNHLFFLYGTINWARITLDVGGLPHKESFVAPPWIVQQGQDHIGGWWL